MKSTGKEKKKTCQRELKSDAAAPVILKIIFLCNIAHNHFSGGHVSVTNNHSCFADLMKNNGLRKPVCSSKILDRVCSKQVQSVDWQYIFLHSHSCILQGYDSCRFSEWIEGYGWVHYPVSRPLSPYGILFFGDGNQTPIAQQFELFHVQQLPFNNM